MGAAMGKLVRRIQHCFKHLSLACHMSAPNVERVSADMKSKSMKKDEFIRRFVDHTVKIVGDVAEAALLYWKEPMGDDTPEECAELDVACWGEKEL